MNISMLKKVRAAILKRPRQFEMGSFFSNDLIFMVSSKGVPAESHKKVPASHCGTTACIAGWAIHLHGGLKTPAETHAASVGNLFGDYLYYDRAGASVLELTEPAATRLFYTSGWPERFRIKYDTATTAIARAKAAADRIDHFIATEGRE